MKDIIYNILNDKYYKNYKFLFNNYLMNKFIIINENLLFNFRFTNICKFNFLYDYKTQIYYDIITNKIDTPKTNKFVFQTIYTNLIINNYIKNNKIKKKLLITNTGILLTNYYTLQKQTNMDIILIYNSNSTPKRIKNKMTLEIPKYVNTFNYIYSSYDPDIYKQFLINLKNNSENNNISIPKHKYELIACEIDYIFGLSLSSSYIMNLLIPNIIATIVISLKNIEKDGILLLFWSIININIPVIKKILSLLSYGFENVSIIDNDINQNLLIGVPEYYIKCSGYKNNISNELINKLLDIAIESIEYTYPICDILDYYEDYSVKNPNHKLFYNKNEDYELQDTSKRPKKSVQSVQSLKLIDNEKQEIKAIYYIEDINIPELDEIMKDSQLQFKVSNLEHKLESIFIGYFEMVNNYILNAIDTDSKGNMIVKPHAIQQKDITNLTKLINMFEYNKLPYNKHALAILLEKKNEYTDYIYGLTNTIDNTLVKYTDYNTVKLNKLALDNFTLSKPYSDDGYNNYIDKITISNKVKGKLLEDSKDSKDSKSNNQCNSNTCRDNRDNREIEFEEFENENDILSQLSKGLSAYIKLDVKPNKIPITVKDFLSLASTIKSNLGISDDSNDSNDSNNYKVGFIVREHNRILYDNYEKVNYNKNVLVHDILTKEVKKLNIPFKTTSFDNKTFEEQADFLKDVKILIACHGASFTNLFLLPKNATIMEVSFRKYWYCDPVCQCHVSGQCPYKKDCHTVSDSRHYNTRTKKLEYHKADYYNLSQLFGIGYKEILIEDANGYFKNPNDKDYNPINLTNIYIDTNAMLDMIKKLY